MKNKKQILIDKLRKEKVFWSYDKPLLKNIPDDLLIEKVIIHLDIREINMLFTIYNKNTILKAWKENVLKLGPRYLPLNRFIAAIYFDYKDPDRVITNYLNKHVYNKKSNHERVNSKH